MTHPKLLSNLPIEDLTSETDYLGIIDKGDLIKTFLIGNKDQFSEIKMFSLYGEWGSGKSSLMKYLEKELNGDFNTFFFEAWEFEKDENLAMSLLEFITYKRIDVTEELCANVLKYGGRILRGLGKSVKLNIPLLANGSALEFDTSALVEEISKNEQLTFYKALELFKTEFIRLEDNITRGNNPKYNIVFIDDLDRCEPEQVLNLLSAIKLFFTYGKKTIFFFGIDKKAAEQAVKTKYGEIVKANEYLEKVFDISFSMPQHENVLGIIRVYFDNRQIEYGRFKGDLDLKISDFFLQLNFTNPRRIKKILNKYLMLSNFKTLLKDDLKFDNLIPNIFVEKNGNFFETILTLYLLCLFEYDKDAFEIFNDLNLKKQKIKSAIEKYDSHTQSQINSKIINVLSNINDEDFNLTFQSLHKRYVHNQVVVDNHHISKHRILSNFLVHFVNGNDTEFGNSPLDDYDSYLKYYRVSKKKIDYLFLGYMLKNFENLIQTDDFSEFSLSKFKNMFDRLI